MYELLYNPDTWDVPIAFVDPFTNKVPTAEQGLVDGIGRKNVRVIGEVDLNNLPI